MGTILKICMPLVLLSLACKFTLVSSKVNIIVITQKHLSPSAKQQPKLSCSDEEILITEKISKPKCFPKIYLLYQNECTRNEQCIAKNSYCGFDYHDSDNENEAVDDDNSVIATKKLCICKDGGYQRTWDNSACVRAMSCGPSFNANSTTGELNCPFRNQICDEEDGFCHCADGFAFNRIGECIVIPVPKWILFSAAAASGILVGVVLGTVLGILAYLAKSYLSSKNFQSRAKNRKTGSEYNSEVDDDEMDGIVVQPNDSYNTRL